jgi:type IV pilus assembly protein PilA
MNYIFWAAILVVAALLFMLFKQPYRGPEPMESDEMNQLFPRRERMKVKRDSGFTLIEVLIVVAIIAILAALSIPNLLRAKMSANETSAIGSLRTLNTACIAYATSYGQFPSSLANLGGTTGTATSAAADLIDPILAAGQKSGYTFGYGYASGGQSYTITATPISVGTSGQRAFFTNETGVIRFDASGVSGSAGATSTPIG